MIDPSEHSPSAPAPSSGPEMERQEELRTQVTSLVRGNRPCVQCGYNLMGQTIWREQHYDMLVVRCPECGTIASIQEHPLLGRWASRWAMVFAALWFLFVIVFLLGGSAGISGFASATGLDASRPFAGWLEERYRQEHPNEASSSGMPVGFGQGFSTWWQKQDARALLTEAGGLSAFIGWDILAYWIPFALMVCVWGCFWAALLVHWSRLKLMGWAILHFVVTLAWGLLFARAYDTSPFGFFSSWHAAQQTVGPTIMYLTIFIAAIAFTIGLLVGRPVVRTLIRFLLPPRMQSLMAELWLADGLDPPSFTVAR